MSVIINPIITNAGLNVFTPLATGIEFTFTHVAVGTGTSAVNANATALQNEIDRFTIAGGGVIAGGKAVSINALVTNHANANPQDYNISEIGFYGLDANNNTVLFAIHRQSTTIVRKVAGADIALPFVLGLSALPVENMTVTIDTNTSGALALLGQHVANAHPHTQYKRTLDNTEQLKIANGTDNDHAVSKGQLNAVLAQINNVVFCGSNLQYFYVGPHAFTIPANKVVRVLLIGGGGGGGGIANDEYSGASSGSDGNASSIYPVGNPSAFFLKANGGRAGHGVTTSNGSNTVYGVHGTDSEVELNNLYDAVILSYQNGLVPNNWDTTPQINHPVIKKLALTDYGQGGLCGSSGYGRAGSGSGGAFVEGLIKNNGNVPLNLTIEVGTGGASSTGNYSNGQNGGHGVCVVIYE